MNVNSISVLSRVEPSETDSLVTIVNTGFTSIFEDEKGMPLEYADARKHMLIEMAYLYFSKKFPYFVQHVLKYAAEVSDTTGDARYITLANELFKEEEE